MKKTLTRIPWLELILIVGLAVALIVKPRTTALSATPDAGRTTAPVNSAIPLSLAIQPSAGL
jgi:hypothetical protein